MAEVEVGEGERYLTSNVEGGRTGTTTGAGLAADDRGNSRLREIRFSLKTICLKIYDKCWIMLHTAAPEILLSLLFFSHRFDVAWLS